MVVVVEKTTNNNERGNCIYVLYCMYYYTYTSTLFSRLVRCGYRGKLSFFFLSFLVRRAPRGVLLQYGRFRDRLVSLSRERVKSVIVRPGGENETRQTDKTDRQENASPERVLRGRVSNWGWQGRAERQKKRERKAERERVSE